MVTVRGPSTPNLPTVPTAMPAPKYVPPHRRHPLALPPSSQHRHLTVSLSFHYRPLRYCSFRSRPLIISPPPPRRTITLVPSLHSSLSAYLIILFFLWFHFYLLTPIYPYLYLYTLPFLAEIPIFSFRISCQVSNYVLYLLRNIFILGSPARLAPPVAC